MKKLFKKKFNIKNFDLKKSLRKTWGIIKYTFLITIYGIYLIVQLFAKKLKFLKKVENFLYNLMNKLDNPAKGQISKTELIDLSIQNMISKKNRFIVTVGGMTVGIAGIVFLVSVGYGLQAMVINRVARLEEMKQTDVSVLPGSKLFLNDDTLRSFNEVENVELALPQIAVVGKVNFNESVTDMAVYGVTREYLEQSAIAPVQGKIFDNNELKTDVVVTKENVEISQDEDTTPTDDELLGDFVEVEGESDLEVTFIVSKVKFPESMNDKQAVVNRSFLTVLAIDEEEAVGQTFSVTFVATDRSELGVQSRIESTTEEYEIIGITPDDATPLFYVPFIHLRVLGIEDYSQVKVVVNEERNLPEARRTIEAQGFGTSSVVDTVAEIEGFFSTTRTILALLGTVALMVAGLGMFNTLTVSLLERTREIGLLKAMGMKSDEVRELFLAESMLMGSLGGFLGILVGLLFGKFLELLLSIYASINGAGTVTIIDMPILFVISIITISFLVGIITGIYPAMRATKISALNALRYE
jgi:ABC-type lipoprotein release transport system permease subunit